MPGPDLHLHTTASDGALSPRELVRAAAHAGLPAIAITDHDTVEGVAEALEAADEFGITVIPGVELSAGIGDRDVHILGYFIDHTRKDLLEHLEELRAIRVQRAERIVSALRSDGFDIALDDVLRSADGGAVGRAHIAHLLVDAGHVDSVHEAFGRLLGSSAPYYVPKPVAPPAEVIGWIERAGGVAVLAHPALSKIDDLVPELAREGIVGIEAYHGSHDAETRERYERIGRQLGLVLTGGSDYHGDEHEGGGLGSANVPDEAVSQLAETLTRIRS